MDLESLDSDDLTAKLVLRAVGLDQRKFNGLVFDGGYPAAPDAGRGTPRVFKDVPDLLGLYCLARMNDFGITMPVAGALASIIVQHLRANERDSNPIIPTRAIVTQDKTGWGVQLDDGRLEIASETGLSLVFDLARALRETRLGLDRVKAELAREGAAIKRPRSAKKGEQRHAAVETAG